MKGGNEVNDYKRRVLHALIDRGVPQTWLCREIAARTGLFIDGSYLSKVLSGRRESPKIRAAIRDILGVE